MRWQTFAVLKNQKQKRWDKKMLCSPQREEKLNEVRFRATVESSLWPHRFHWRLVINLLQRRASGRKLFWRAKPSLKHLKLLVVAQPHQLSHTRTPLAFADDENVKIPRNKRRSFHSSWNNGQKQFNFVSQVQIHLSLNNRKSQERRKRIILSFSWKISPPRMDRRTS